MWQVVPTTLVGLFVSGLSAYAFAKIPFRGKNGLFLCLIATMMIPGAALTMPSYLFYDAIGWTNSVLPLMIPALFGGAGITFFLRQFFMGLPNELVEAARIDGASKNRIFWQMIIPLSKPIIVYTILTTFISPWCDYIMASVFIHDTSKYTIAVGIRAWVTDRELVNRMFTRFCAGSVLISVPIVILFMIMQKFYVAGITGGAAKG